LAEEIVKGMKNDGDCDHEAVGRIAQALTAYADERVREAQGLTYDDGFKDGKAGREIIDDCVKEARADGLEEAAKVAENSFQEDEGVEDVGHVIADSIRALKDKT
jgi:N-acetylglutamate synthase-like GNAT family acetyltransferase